MTSGLEELAERVENLTGPCRETDAQIKIAFAAQLFAGGATKDDAVKILGGDLYAEPLPYTASLDAAMTLVPEGAEWEVTTLYGVAQVTMPLNDLIDGWQTVRREDGNVILAFVECCLRARAASEPSHGR